MSKGPILILSGTMRPGSNALRVSNVLLGHYKAAGANAQILSLAELPAEAFAPSIYATKPASIEAIQQRILDCSGVHIVTPEYNGSFPGVLKHFIDLLKFPESFEGKPVAFTGEGAGIWGGLRSVEQLAAIFSYRNAHLFPERVFIPGVTQKFDGEGRFTDVDCDTRLGKQAKGFVAFVAKVSQ